MKYVILNIALVTSLILLNASTGESVTSLSKQDPNVSSLVPRDLEFATPFVQKLSDSGLKVLAVRYSKFNGGILSTTRAAWVKTDKGIVEVLFFETTAEVEKIQITEVEGSTSNYHKYTVTDGVQLHPWEGRLPVFFRKYGNVLAITYDEKFRDVMSQLLTERPSTTP
jgi:hypothetical protein